MKSSKTINVLDFIYFSTILLLILLPIITTGNLPGLYLDAINPDYAAVQILFPQQYQIKWMVGWPFIAQLYHGNINTFISMFTILLTGTTSILQHHLTNGMICFTICIIFYRILQKLGIGEWLCKSSTMVLATMPTLLTACYTQYYIELPGTLLISLSILCLITWKTNQTKELYLPLLASLFCGIAFYSYFNFLFFYPIVIGIIIYNTNNVHTKIKYAITSIACFISGASFYFLGYATIYINQNPMPERLKVLFLISIALCIYALTIIIIISINKYYKGAIISFTVLIVSLSCILFKILPSISTHLNSLNVQGDSISFSERLQRLFSYITLAVSGRSGEIIIFSESVTRYSEIYILILCTLFILSIILSISKKTFTQVSMNKIMWLTLFCYYICSIILASRMQVQHFIPLIVIILLIISLSTEKIYSMLQHKRLKQITKYFIICSCIILFTLNIYNKSLIIRQIQSTGGTNLYTHQINELAYDSLDNLADGKKEVYIFKDWGFIFGFNYLTQNKIAVATEFNENTIEHFTSQGYDIVICYWNEADTNYYEDIVNSYKSNMSVSKETLLQKNGSVAFYKLTLHSN